MNVLEEFSKRTPTIILFALVISTLFNAGLLQAAASIDLINSLSYQDIVISTVFIIPVLISLMGIFTGIYNNIYIIVEIDRWWKYILIVFIVFSGLMLVVVSKFAYASFGWVLIFFGLSPFFGMIINILGFPLDRRALATISMLASLCVVSYGSGYSSYNERLCFGDTYISINNCKDCLLIRSYSAFMLLKSAEGVVVVPNNNDFLLKKKAIDLDATLESAECNPIGVGLSRLK